MMLRLTSVLFFHTRLCDSVDSLFQITHIRKATDEHTSIIIPTAYRSHKAPRNTMEVLMHEASSQKQEETTNAAPVRVVDSKFACKEMQENDSITHNDIKESIDIIFEDITYTVRLGYRKSKFFIINKLFADCKTDYITIYVHNYIRIVEISAFLSIQFTHLRS